MTKSNIEQLAELLNERAERDAEHVHIDEGTDYVKVHLGHGRHPNELYTDVRAFVNKRTSRDADNYFTVEITGVSEYEVRFRTNQTVLD